jgi:hypothetical protein
MKKAYRAVMFSCLTPGRDARLLPRLRPRPAWPWALNSSRRRPVYFSSGSPYKIYRARKVLDWPKRCKLAHAFLWEYKSNRLKLAQLLGRHGGFLTQGGVRVTFTPTRRPAGLRAARVRRGGRGDKSECHFRKKAAGWDRKPGMKRLSCTAK